MLIGGAFGLSIADVDDSATIDAGFGIGAALWFIVSWVLAYFIGGLLTARLAGSRDDNVGMMHGLTVWSLGAVTTVVLASFGVRNVIAAGQAVASAGASASTALASGMASNAAGAAGSMTAAIEGLTDEVGGAVRRQLVEAASAADGPGGATPSEIEDAMQGLSDRALGNLAVALADGDLRRARGILTDATELDEGDIEGMVSGLGRTLRSNSTVERARVEARELLEAAQSDAVSFLDQLAGSEASRDQLRRTVEELDMETTRAVASALISGDPGRAKSVLAARTPLDEADIEAIVDGARDEVQERVDAVVQTARDAAEAANAYGQAVLWTAVLASLAALLAAIFGAKLGTLPDPEDAGSASGNRSAA